MCACVLLAVFQTLAIDSRSLPPYLVYTPLGGVPLSLETTTSTSSSQPYLFCGPLPIYYYFHGLVQSVSSFQIQLLLVLKSAMVPISIVQKHPVERLKLIDM